MKPTYTGLERRVAELEKAEKKVSTLEDRLQEELNWRKLLIEESRDGIVIIDQACKVFDTNKKFAEQLGYTVEEVLQMHVWDWDSVHSREEIIELAIQVDSKGHHFETRLRCKDGSLIDVELSNNGTVYQGQKLIFCICRDITEKLQYLKERELIIKELKDALAEVKTLRGILPLCSFCKNIRNDDGYWEQVDIYINKNSAADISHGICPECMRLHYPGILTEKP